MAVSSAMVSAPLVVPLSSPSRHVRIARELHGTFVGNADGCSVSWRAFKDDQKSIEQTVVGEYLENLLWVVGTCQEFDLSIQLPGACVEQYRNGANVAIYRYLLDGSSLDVDSLAGTGDLLSQVGDWTFGVHGFRVEGKFVLGDVADFHLFQN